MEKHLWIINLNPKIDSKRQRRLQCSLSLNLLIEKSINYNIIHTSYDSRFMNIQLPININSKQREFNK